MSAARWRADGSKAKALRNIEVTLDHVLSEKTKALINWHSEQNLHLAVMRLANEYEELRARMEGLEK